jgi:formate dehydrogenase gamma subunit
MKRLFLILFLSVVAPLTLLAGDDTPCADCHADASMTRTLPNGAVQSLAVTKDSLLYSRHVDLNCVDCHRDLRNYSDWPHPEHLKAVNCAICHPEPARAVAAGGHEGNLSCAACHGTHNIGDPNRPQSPLSPGRINTTCANCHDALHAPHRGRTAKYATYDVGLHGSHPVASGPGGPTCTDCHGTHTIDSEHKLADHLEAACLKCHPHVGEQFKQSVHASLNEGRANSHCYDCHGEHRSRAPSDTTLRVLNESPAEATCGTCHAETVALYNQSLHAYALKSGSPRAPRCESCHGAHDIRKVRDPESPMYRTRQPETCAKCHSKIAITPDPDVRLPRSFENYEESTHGKLLAEGNQNVPVCTDCHGGHAIRPASDPTSAIFPLNLDRTCGQCHPTEDSLYQESIHYRALKAGIEDAPNCTGCHGEHIMLSPTNPKSKVSHSEVARETCGKCHENPVIIRKYGLAPNVVETYQDSYHGLATLARSRRTPSCPDCHNAHDVRTERDSLSTISTANVTRTCGKCHKEADAKFAQSYTHRALQPTQGGVTYWISRIYWVLLAVIIGGMILHNLVILNFYVLRAKKDQTTGRKVTRFDTHQLIQHMALTVSFTLLAISGFALKFPNAWWVKVLAAFGLDEPARRILHRVMAIVLIACSIYHIVYLFLTRRGRNEWKALLPSRADVHDFAQTMKFFTWRSEKPPQYGRYDYSQKAEYWALIWGTLLMIATGLVLWFPTLLAPILPWWGVAAAQTIHLYEAWLATLAIVVWHFFFTIFHPEEYPMSWTWLTGKINLDQVAHRHGRWYRQITGDAPPPDPAIEEVDEQAKV